MGESEGAPSALLELWAHPARRREGVRWDPWRHRWVVEVTSAPQRGEANDAIHALLSEVLSVPRDRLVWVRSGTSREKTVRVLGLAPEEVEDRLRRAEARGAAGTSGGA